MMGKDFGQGLDRAEMREARLQRRPTLHIFPVLENLRDGDPAMMLNGSSRFYRFYRLDGRDAMLATAQSKRNGFCAQNAHAEMRSRG